MCILLWAGMGACDVDVRPALDPVEPSPRQTPAVPPASPPGEGGASHETQVPSVEAPWVWYRSLPDEGVSGWFRGALSGRAAFHEVGRPHRFVAEREGTSVVLRREDGALDAVPTTPTWSQRYELEAIGAPVVGRLVGDALAVAAPTDEGYVVLSVDPESGEPRWTARHEADGSGPVQLGAGEGGVQVYVSADRGPYVHVLDTADGALRGRVRYGPDVRRPFTPPAVSTSVAVGRPSEAGYRLVRAGRERRAVVGPGWRQELPEAVSFSTHASFVEVDDLVVVVTFCHGASGSAVHALDRVTGTVRWRTSGGSIGSVAHSRYSNEVRVRREGGLLLVYGDESGGRYVGVIDLSVGRLLGYEVWRR